MCCYKNTLILANSDVLYISMHNFQRVAPTTPPDTTLVSSFSRFELNTLNLALGGIFVLHKTKYSIAYGGTAPQTPCFRDPATTVISPSSQKILDPTLLAAFGFFSSSIEIINVIRLFFSSSLPIISYTRPGYTYS